MAKNWLEKPEPICKVGKKTKNLKTVNNG